MEAMDRRKRSGKGLGAPLLEIQDAVSSERPLLESTNSSSGPGAEEMRALHDERNRIASESSGDRREVLAGVHVETNDNAAVATNPFWSEETKRRVEEHFIGSARATSVAASPIGIPASLGPEPPVASLGAEKGPEGFSEPAGSTMSHGLSERERAVLTEMKNAMVRIASQNEELVTVNVALRQRVEKLEAEKGSVWWTAAGSTPDGAETVGWDDQKGTRGVGNLGDHVGIGGTDSRDVGDSIQYQQGFEKGCIAAKEMLDAQARVASQVYSTHDYPQLSASCSTPQKSSPSVPVGTTFQTTSPPSVRSLLEEHVELRERTPSPNPDRYQVFGCATTPQGNAGSSRSSAWYLSAESNHS